MERTLLVVDDEENILRSLRRLFRRQGYQILTAGSGQEGLERLKEQPVGVIVSDQRMPQMTGIEFLQQVRELYPETVRIILSGYTDLESVTNSINTGAIFKFLTKPWDDEQLCQHVQEAFEIHELSAENQRLNEALLAANRELEGRVQEQERESQFSLQALRASQNILEWLPIAVLGISEDQVVVANRAARACLKETGGLLGMPVTEGLPDPLLALYRQAQASGKPVQGEWQCQGEGACRDQLLRVACQRNPGADMDEGYILTWRDHAAEGGRSDADAVGRVIGQ